MESDCLVVHTRGVSWRALALIFALEKRIGRDRCSGTQGSNTQRREALVLHGRTGGEESVSDKVLKKKQRMEVLLSACQEMAWNRSNDRTCTQHEDG